ncbi:MAG TPA: DUF4328 domain-containing protein [Allosphingosinicella sp.]|jgi:hypothetical protein|nr:DUF4328 domain-containing protein [Allosphingosinicella sp.]
MEGFRDPTLLSRVATVALGAYAVSKTFTAIMWFIDPGAIAAVGVGAILYLVALLACYVLVAMWIYRTNANAHLFSDDVTITPGWSVGWFFVPFANLVMPFRGVRETWQESHEAAGRFEEVDSPLLGWWWGLWIATNIVSNMAGMFGGYNPDALEAAPYVNLAAAAMSVASSLVLIQLMRRLNSAQLAASQGSVFA